MQQPPAPKAIHGGLLSVYQRIQQAIRFGDSVLLQYRLAIKAPSPSFRSNSMKYQGQQNTDHKGPSPRPRCVAV